MIGLRSESSTRRTFLGRAAALHALASYSSTSAAASVNYRPFSESGREPDLLVRLWPEGRMPGGPQPDITETVDDQTDTGGLRYRVAAHVTHPTISYFAPKTSTGAAVLIIPGGGYSRVGIDREGFETARWFASRGIAAFVLKYRLPVDRWPGGAAVALQDAQRAIRLIRAGNAARWRVDPARVSVLGGSAGGHLAGCLCTKVYERTYEPIDAADHLLTRPDGAILLYPVISMGRSGHAGSKLALLGGSPSVADIAYWSLEMGVPGITPPMLLVHAAHDRIVSVDQSLAMFSAVRASGGAVDLHVFDEGAHGVGLRGDPAWPMSDWPQLAERWMSRSGLA